MNVRLPDNLKHLQHAAGHHLRCRPLSLLWISVATAVVCSFSAPAMAIGPDAGVNARREYNVKAVSIYGFCRFVTWPQTTFDTADADLVVGIIGDSLIAAPLEAIATKKTVMQRRLRILKCNEPKDVLKCHVTFVSKSLPLTQQKEIIRLSEGQPVMLVGERGGFAETGGVANFFIRGGRVQFELNHHAARKRGLKLDAKLLSLGTQIR